VKVTHVETDFMFVATVERFAILVANTDRPRKKREITGVERNVWKCDKRNGRREHKFA
jgi:hypothetical protein